MRIKKECKTSFLRVRCVKCKNEQNIFSVISTKVSCLVCGELIAEPTGGKNKMHAKVLEVHQ